MYLSYIANVRLPTEKAHGLQIMKMCEAFACTAEVELIVPRRQNPITADPFEYYGVKKDFTVTSLPCFDTVRFGRLGFWIEQMSFLHKAKRYLHAKSSTVYTREEAVGLFFDSFVLELHTLPKVPSAFKKKIWHKAQRLFVLTSFMQEQIVEWGIAQEKISVLPDAVDIKEFDIPVSKEEARKKLNLPLEKKIALYTGSFFLYPWKGVDTFLEAATHDTNTLFLAVGGSSREVEEAQKKYTAKNIVYAGYRPHAEIPYYLKAADVLVLPNKSGYSMSEKHTSPLKLFEYMASGRPIVSSSLPSIREALSESEAVFFTPNDPRDLARAIADVLSDVALAGRLARSARTKAEEYTWEKRAAKALKFLKDDSFVRP